MKRDIAAANAEVARLPDDAIADHFRRLARPTTADPATETVLVSEYEYARFYRAAYGTDAVPSADAALGTTRAHRFRKAELVAWAIRLDSARRGAEPGLGELDDFHRAGRRGP